MTYVYFIANDARNLLKIGTSDTPRSRLMALAASTADSLRLVALVPGDERYESALHERFAALRVAGEWFTFSGELRDLVKLLPTVDEDAKPTKTRERTRPTLSAEQKRDIAARHTEWIEEARRGVQIIGLTDFADAIDADRHDIARALSFDKNSGPSCGNRYFRFEWWLALRELVRSMPMGAELLEQTYRGQR